jgi:hypothetical protein
VWDRRAGKNIAFAEATEELAWNTAQITVEDEPSAWIPATALPTTEERNAYCALAMAQAKVLYPDWWKPNFGGDQYLGLITRFSGVVADYALLRERQLLSRISQLEAEQSSQQKADTPEEVIS